MMIDSKLNRQGCTDLTCWIGISPDSDFLKRIRFWQQHDQTQCLWILKFSGSAISYCSFIQWYWAANCVVGASVTLYKNYTNAFHLRWYKEGSALGIIRYHPVYLSSPGENKLDQCIRTNTLHIRSSVFSLWPMHQKNSNYIWSQCTKVLDSFIELQQNDCSTY